MVHVFKTILLVLITNHLIAATYTTIGSGSWTDNALWLGGVAPPTNASNNEIITIESAHTVTFIGNLVFQNNCSITILGNLFIEGSFEADNNYTTNISGHLLVTGNFTIKNNANIDVDGSLTIYGDFTGNNGNVLIGDGEVSVHGTMNGINDTGFVGTVSENMVGSIGLLNKGCVIKIGSNDVIYIDGGNSGNFNSFFAAGANGLIDSDGTIIIEGNWFNYSGDNVYSNLDETGNTLFKGSTIQQLGGANKTHFEQLTLNNIQGILMDNNIVIEESLIFSNGSIVTGKTDTVIIKKAAVSAIVNQGVGKSVVGNLRRYLTQDDYIFPLMNGENYLPALIEITELGSMSYLSAKFTPTAFEPVPLGLNVDGTPIVEFLNKGYWTFTPDNSAGVVYDITLTSSGHSNGGLESAQHAIFKRNLPDEWKNEGLHDNDSQSGTENNPITAKRSGLSAFSDFIIGLSDLSPLPIKLSHFEADCSDKGVQLFWETLMEQNNNFFTISYSFNGVDFKKIANIPGEGTTYSKQNYSYVHQIKTGSVVYYKLTQTDFNGKQYSYPIIPVQCKLDNSEEISIDKIENNSISLSYSSGFRNDLHFYLTDQLGRIVYTTKIQSNEGFNYHTIDLPRLKSGIYLFHSLFGSKKQSIKIILN